VGVAMMARLLRGRSDLPYHSFGRVGASSLHRFSTTGTGGGILVLAAIVALCN